MRKYALVGTSCVGKTSILHEVCGRDGLEFCQPVEEAARVYFQSVRAGRPFLLRHQERIQEMVIDAESDAAATGASVLLCDRSILDPIVYVEAAGDRAGAARLKEAAGDWVNSYTGFILLSPVGVPYRRDAIRREPEAFRNWVHEVFVKVLEKSGLPYMLLGGEFLDRVERVRGIVAGEDFSGIDYPQTSTWTRLATGGDVA